MKLRNFIFFGLIFPFAAFAAKTTDTPRDFPPIVTKAEWTTRAAQIREQILVSAGLWPMPDKTPLHAHIFAKEARDGYTVEKVAIESWPGFYLAGNLYRPVDKGAGPFPAVLNPHGHWEFGRLTDIELGSIPARCINFARQGMIAFAYDMVGYNDTRFADSPASATFSAIHHHFAAKDPSALLWNVSLMGLQTWDSIRALDFLESLPDVDRTRIGCTGASGGGSQTFIFGAIDDRLAAQAPVNMVSHTMQGGCLCENMPGLRVEYSNMEIAAAAAPRPQLLVAATGDWTKTVPTVEGPAIETIYNLFNAPEKFRYVQFNAPHNYNLASREAVYDWFGRWLLTHPNPASLREHPHEKIPDATLRLWPDGKLPANALTEKQVINSLKQSALSRWKANVSTAQYRDIYLPAWRHTLQVEWPMAQGHVSVHDNLLSFSVPGKTDDIEVESVSPKRSRRGAPVLAILSELQPELARRLNEKGDTVWIIRKFSSVTPGNPFTNFFTTYNRTLAQERVRDLAILASTARAMVDGTRVVFCGQGNAAEWMLLAAPAADAVEADSFPEDNDRAYLAPEIFCPGVRSLGGCEGVAALAAPHPLLLQRMDPRLKLEALRNVYKMAGAAKNLSVAEKPLSDVAMAKWINQVVN